MEVGGPGDGRLVERVPVMAAFPESPPVAWGALLTTATQSLVVARDEPPAGLAELRGVLLRELTWLRREGLA